MLSDEHLWTTLPEHVFEICTRRADTPIRMESVACSALQWHLGNHLVAWPSLRSLPQV